MFIKYMINAAVQLKMKHNEKSKKMYYLKFNFIPICLLHGYKNFKKGKNRDCFVIIPHFLRIYNWRYFQSLLFWNSECGLDCRRCFEF